MFDASTFLPSPSRAPFRARRLVPAFHNVILTAETPPPPLAAARGQKLAGLKFERRVHDILYAIYEHAFRASPVIRYQTSDGRKDHRAIPDGILVMADWTVIVEVKLAHTEVVWEQLMERYVPLVARLTDAPLRPVEICRSYDPAVPLPGPHTLVESLHRPPSVMGQLEVLQWRI